MDVFFSPAAAAPVSSYRYILVRCVGMSHCLCGGGGGDDGSGACG